MVSVLVDTFVMKALNIPTRSMLDMNRAMSRSTMENPFTWLRDFCFPDGMIEPSQKTVSVALKSITTT